MGRPSTKIRTSCKTCEKIFLFSPSQKRKYCSLSCFFQAKKKLLSLNAKCSYCKKKFHVKPSKFKWGKGKYCSKKCYSESQKIRLEIKCPVCRKVFIGLPYRVYCSEKCAKKDMVGRKNGMWKESIKLICEHCKKTFYMKPWESRVGDGRRFCSSSCRYKELKGEKHSNWLGGISWEPYGMAFNNELKENIRQRDNYTCRVIDCNNRQNGKKFPIHHIDYCKQNNDEDNLITLCHSHHNKSNFNREYWENYFRTIIT